MPAAHAEYRVHSHIGYVTRDEYERHFSDIFDQIVAYAAGSPIHVMNPAVLSRGQLANPHACSRASLNWETLRRIWRWCLARWSTSRSSTTNDAGFTPQCGFLLAASTARSSSVSVFSASADRLTALRMSARTSSSSKVDVLVTAARRAASVWSRPQRSPDRLAMRNASPVQNGTNSRM